MAKQSTSRPFYDEERTVGRKAIYSWRPSVRWPTTHWETHHPDHADVQQFHGLVFRSEADAAAHNTAYLDPAEYPQPFVFATWAEAEKWVEQP